MQKVLQHYLKRLTNLSGNNRSLLLLRLISDQFIDVHAFDYLNQDASFSIISDLIAQKEKIKLCDTLDSRDKATNQVSMQLKRISRIEQYIFQERGAKDLYVGWPFLRGKFSDGTPLRCPLLFFPVELVNEENQWMLAFRKEVNITFNKSFLLAYAYYNQVQLEDELVERVFDDFDRDSRVFRTELYQLLKDSPVEINFNQENFLDQLNEFSNYKKADFVDSHHDGEIKLFPEAVLGIFPQAGSYLVPDYIHLLENETHEELEEFFVNRTVNEDKLDYQHSASYYTFLNKIKEEQTFTPFKMDAYQENAIKAVKRGNSLVVQGPPGTGKSQLICNLISDFIARGKKVLMVCQKKAALDVVYHRLEENGIADFVALVHDFKDDRKDIYAKINDQIERLYEYRMKNSSLDAIQLERNFLYSSRKIDQITEELDDFRFALFDESEAGVSVKELYLTSDHTSPVINLKQEFKYFRLDAITPFIDKLKTYFAYHKIFSDYDYLWRIRRSFAGYTISDLQKIRTLLSDIVESQERFSKQVRDLLGFEMDFSAGEKIFEKREKIEAMVNYLDDKTVYEYFCFMIKHQDASPDFLWLSNAEKNLMTCFKDVGPEVSLSKKELGRFQMILKERRSSQKNFYQFIRWKLFSKDKPYLKKVLAHNNLSSKKIGLKTLERKIDNRLNLEHNLTKLRETKWLKDVPEKYLVNDFVVWFDHQKKAVQAFSIFHQFRNFKEYLPTTKLGLNEFKDKVLKLADLTIDLPVKKQGWLKYLHEARIESLLANPDLYEPILNTLNRDFDALCDFDNLSAGLEPHEKSVMDKLVGTDEVNDENDALAIFQNSLRLAWIEYIESKYPVLRAVSSLKFERMQKELQEEVKNKLQASTDITLLKSRERTYSDVEYNRLNNMVTYRDLTHQVTKKRRIWPIRKLIQTFPDELFDIVPCWMGSPESVSAIFPMEQMFDLVIFDEASQCFAERGIPAMYRAKQVVIAGDDKQLSPFDLYKVRWDDESETDDPVMEVDSLLNLASLFLMQVQLKGHYRSKSLDLIDFSNQFFYKGQLTLLPDKNVLNTGEPAIDYIKVNGVWEHNRNEKEAEKVVSIIKSYLEKDEHKEIGVVTFNVNQQDLILDKLELNGISLSECHFIKNIENVQGDEKDVIIFSIGYAPDNKGKFKHQFGTLNVINGENRLNVAVTRAREKIYVVSSILPQQLMVEETKNEGPKYLKKYLQYAYDVSKGKFKPVLPVQGKHSVDWYLKTRLQQLLKDSNKGVEVQPEMPFADLTIKKNNKYLGLLLTDDDHYYQSISVKDMHVYKPFTLSSKNWKFRGITSREYWHDKEQIKEKILKFVQYTDDNDVK